METGKLCRSKQLIPAYKRNRMVFQNDTENPCGSSFFICANSDKNAMLA